MTLLNALNLSASLSQRTVLKGVNLSVGKGEYIGLIGPNGAGKSTFLKATLNLVHSQGTLEIGGTDSRLQTSRQRAKQVAYLPQEREVNWPVTVETLIMLGREYARGPFTSLKTDDRAIVEQAMVRMDVAHLRNRRVTELSGGERARALIARALAQDTPLLMADEPAAGLDPAHQIALMACFKELANEGRSVVACLHEVHLAARWCSRIVLLNEGEVIADGPPDLVLNEALMRDVYGVEIFKMQGETGLVVLPCDLSQTTERGSSAT